MDSKKNNFTGHCFVKKSKSLFLDNSISARNGESFEEDLVRNLNCSI